MKGKYCSVCGAQNELDAKFCIACGAPMLDADNEHFCPACGNTYGRNDKFCPTCGAPVSPEQKAQQSEQDFHKKEAHKKEGQYTKKGRKIIGPRPERNHPAPPSSYISKPKKKKMRSCLFTAAIVLAGIILFFTVAIILFVVFNNRDFFDRRSAMEYQYGIDTAPDPYKAFKLYENAAKDGDTDAMIELSSYYEEGIWVKQDPKKARELLKKAADAGSLPAKWQLEFLERKQR